MTSQTYFHVAKERCVRWVAERKVCTLVGSLRNNCAIVTVDILFYHMEIMKSSTIDLRSRCHLQEFYLAVIKLTPTSSEVIKHGRSLVLLSLCPTSQGCQGYWQTSTPLTSELRSKLSPRAPTQQKVVMQQQPAHCTGTPAALSQV